MKKKAEISRHLIKRTLDELIGWRDYCDEFCDLEGRARIQSIISLSVEAQIAIYKDASREATLAMWGRRNLLDKADEREVAALLSDCQGEDA